MLRLLAHHKPNIINTPNHNPSLGCIPVHMDILHNHIPNIYNQEPTQMNLRKKIKKFFRYLSAKDLPKSVIEKPYPVNWVSPKQAPLRKTPKIEEEED